MHISAERKNLILFIINIFLIRLFLFISDAKLLPNAGLSKLFHHFLPKSIRQQGLFATKATRSPKSCRKRHLFSTLTNKCQNKKKCSIVGKMNAGNAASLLV